MNERRRGFGEILYHCVVLILVLVCLNDAVVVFYITAWIGSVLAIR